jgi:hypothetical protein
MLSEVVLSSGTELTLPAVIAISILFIWKLADGYLAAYNVSIKKY